MIEAANEGQWAATYDELPDMFDDIADEFEDLPPLDGERSKADKAPAPARKGDPDTAFLDYSNLPAPKLPLDILDSRLQKIVRDGGINSGAPDDYVFASILTAASMCLGNSVRVEMEEGFVQPAILWSQIIGGPSAKKSPAMRVVIKCITNIEKRMMVPYLARKEQWEREKAQADRYMKDWETKQKAMIASGQETDPNPPANCIAPEKPTEPMILMSDQSIEAFYRRQYATPRGFGVVRDELAAFLSEMERYDTSNRASWLESYEGGFHRVERVKDEGKVITIPHICAPIMGGIQPERLMDIVSLTTTDDGLQARFLPFWPEDVKWNIFDKADSTADLERVLERLATIPMEKDEHGNPTPFILPMSAKAWRVFGTWLMEAEARDTYVDRRLKGVYGKASGHVARLALILEHLKWAADDFSEDFPGEVGVESVRSAIRFREEYLRPMQKRVHDFASETSETSIARRIANHIIEEKYDIVNARELRRKSGIKGLNSKTLGEVVDEAVAFLMEKRWLFPVEQEKNAKGGRPKKDFKVNPRLWAKL